MWLFEELIRVLHHIASLRCQRKVSLNCQNTWKGRVLRETKLTMPLSHGVEIFRVMHSLAQLSTCLDVPQVEAGA